MHVLFCLCVCLCVCVCVCSMPPFQTDGVVRHECPVAGCAGAFSSPDPPWAAEACVQLCCTLVPLDRERLDQRRKSPGHLLPHGLSLASPPVRPMTRIPPWAVHTGGEGLPGAPSPPSAPALAPPPSHSSLPLRPCDEANLRRYPSMPQTEADPYPRGCVLHVGTR